MGIRRDLPCVNVQKSAMVWSARLHKGLSRSSTEMSTLSPWRSTFMSCKCPITLPFFGVAAVDMPHARRHCRDAELCGNKAQRRNDARCFLPDARTEAGLTAGIIYDFAQASS